MAHLNLVAIRPRPDGSRGTGERGRRRVMGADLPNIHRMPLASSRGEKGSFGRRVFWESPDRRARSAMATLNLSCPGRISRDRVAVAAGVLGEVPPVSAERVQVCRRVSGCLSRVGCRQMPGVAGMSPAVMAVVRAVWSETVRSA